MRHTLNLCCYEVEEMGDFQRIGVGDRVLIVLKKHSYIVRVDKGKKFHTHVGYINLDDLIDAYYGSSHKTSSGVSFTVLRPSKKDYALKLPRSTQVIYPKDAASILVWANIKPGDRVLEAGTGSGGLTIFLADAVGREGVVYGFDVREESLEKTKRNLESVGLLDRVELRRANVLDGVELNGLDAVVLDLPSPWLAVGILKNSLKGDGYFVSFSPTIDQVEKTVIALREKGFIMIEAFELIQRFYDAKPDATRPNSFGVQHTGYIVSARNTLAEGPETPPSDKLSNKESHAPHEFFDSLTDSPATNI
jgi:tRNA (adenine57-N1/adenine58-N1)-methyltransferase